MNKKVEWIVCISKVFMKGLPDFALPLRLKVMRSFQEKLTFGRESID